jgi:hypothetical protein
MKTLTSLKMAITYTAIALCWLLCTAESAAQTAAARQIQGVAHQIQNAARQIQGAAHTLDTTQRARLTVHLTGGSTAARWGYTNPDTGVYNEYASDDTASIKADYWYYITFNTLGGWQQPQPMRAFANANETKTYTAAYTAVPSGYVKVNLTGDNGLGQWQVYANGNVNNVWYNSGDSTRLNEGFYYIIFKNIPNYIRPQYRNEYVVENQTTVVAAAYQAIVYNTVQINIVGANGVGAWRRDADTTRHYSGDTLHLATNNSCSLFTTPVQGWEALGSLYLEGSSLNVGVVNVQTFVYTKIKKAIVRIHINGGGGNGQWSADGRLTWHNSDDTLHTVASNTHIVFKHTPQWTLPNDFYIDAQVLDTAIINNFTATYQPIAYRAVRVTIAGANGSGQWAITDNGVLDANTVWRNSSDTAQVDNRFGYTIVYKNVNGWVTPPNEFIYFGNSQSITRYNTDGEYTPILYGIAKITLTGANGQGQWRVRSNNTGIYYTAWRNHNDTVRLRSDRTNEYLLEFRNVANWDTPTLTMIGVGANHTTTFPFHYTLDTTIINPTTARLTVHLTGDNGQGLWQVNGINYVSDDTITVNVGTFYYIVYSAVAGLVTPNYSTVRAVAGVNTLTTTYNVVQRNYLTVALTGGGGLGRWQANWDGIWHQSGDTITTQPWQSLYIHFKDVPNWRKPEMIQGSAPAGGMSLTADYTPLRYARVVVHINGANGQGRWSIQNGAQHLMPNDTILIPYYVNDFQITFDPVARWYTPNYIYISPDTSQVNEYTVTYVPIVYTPLTVHITGAAGQGRWTADGQTLHRSDDTVQVETNIYQYIEYVDVPDWVTPSSQQILIDLNPISLQGVYRQEQFGSVRVLLTGANGQGQWSLNGGTTWQNSGDSVRVLANSFHYITTKNVGGWYAQTSSNFYISPNQHYTTTIAYLPTVYKTLKVTLVGGGNQGRWRVYNFNDGNYSAWRNSNDTLHLAGNVAYSVFFKNINYWNIPTNNGANVQFFGNDTLTITGIYTPVTYAVLKVILTGDNGLGQWKANNGALHHSNDTIMLPANRSAYIEYTTISGYNTPSSFYIPNLSGSVLNTVFGEYVAIPPPYITFTGHIVGGGSAARWSVDGGNTWHSGGDTLHLATNNSYTLRYKTVAGWSAPAQYDFLAMQDMAYTGTYTVQQFGILKVNIGGSNGKGRWRIGNDMWHIGGDTLHLPTGTTYTIEFKNVSAWITPGNYDYTPVANQTLNLPAQYYETPFTIVQVNLVGGDDEGLWSPGDGHWYNSADTVHLSALQQYALYYRNVNGWITPNTVSPFEPNGNATQTVTATYIRPFSIKKRLQVNLIGGGGLAQWTIDNGNTWKNSGDTLLLQPQNYTITYKNVSSWITPLFSSFRGQDGDSTITTTYRAIQYNTLQVNLVGGGGLAQWTIDNGTTWHNSGDTLHLPSHINHYINYKTVAGWIKPNFNAYPATTVPSTVITATYQAIGYGILQVNMTSGPALAQWSINGTRWLNSGDTLRLPNTQAMYFVSYKTVAGWIKPQGASYAVPANQTTVVNAAYLQMGYGILQVNITGGGGLGAWSIDNGATWRNSGDTITLSNSIIYTIKYKAVTAWNTPLSVTFRAIVGQATTIGGIYTPTVAPPQTALKVLLTGGNGQGLWSLDQVTWNNSGDSIPFANGSNWYTVYFAPVTGWIKPIPQSGSLINGRTVTVIGDYVVQIGTTNDNAESSLRVFPNPANEILHLSLKGKDADGFSRLRLYNAVGVLVYESSFLNPTSSLAANDTHDLNLLPYPTGFYVLSLYNERTGASVQQKVVVRR